VAVLARYNATSQSRYDLHCLLADQSFNMTDFRLFGTIFSGSQKNYIITGLDIQNTNSQQITINVAGSVLFSPLDNATSFYIALADEPTVSFSLPANQTVYVEAYFERLTENPVPTAQWDPGAITTANPAGTEFSTSVNFQEYVQIKFRYNTTGFTSNAIKVAKLIVGAGSVTSIYDARDLFFRLGSGGSVPDPIHKYSWSPSREEPNVVGNPTQIGLANVNNPYYSIDGSGIKNDKAISSLKDWMDAVMSIIAEMKGTAYWYDTASTHTPSNTYFDSRNGQSPVPNSEITLGWDSGTQVLQCLARTPATGPLKWKSNYGRLLWNLGGVFDVGARSYSNTLFTKTIPNTDCAVFLKLEREIKPVAATDIEVLWRGLIPPAGWPHSAEDSVYCSTQGAFTGIAVGDWIRQQTASYFDYFKVLSFSDGVTEIATEGAIAGVSAKYLLLDTYGGTVRPVTAVVKYYWFRANYSNDDIYYTEAANEFLATNGVATIAADLPDLQFLGRRKNNIFDPDQDYFGIDKEITRKVLATTSIGGTTTVLHSFILPTKDFIWQIKDQSTGQTLVADCIQTTTGLVIQPTYAVFNIDVQFSRKDWVS